MLEYYEVSSLVHTRTNKGTKVIVFHNFAITNQTREREVSAAATRLCVHLFGLHVGQTNRWRRRVESVGESRCKAGRDFASTDGGAISIGHPLGASGARIVGKAASILNRTNSERAIATMCIGGGMGITIVLESP